jgi:hypothetical protein
MSISLPFGSISMGTFSRGFEFLRQLAATCPQPRQTKHLIAFLQKVLEWDEDRHLEHGAKLKSLFLCSRTEEELWWLKTF